MSNTISVALKAHYAQESTTLCQLLKVTRLDGAVYAFNTTPADITYLSLLYSTTNAVNSSAVKTAAALNVDNLEMDSFIDGVIITEADVLAGKWDLAVFEIVEVNYADLTMGHRHIKKGTLGIISTGRQAAKFELRGLTQKLQQQVGRIIMSECDADLGDARCAVNLAPFTFTETITAVTDNRTFTASGLVQADDYFAAGKLTFTSGANNGASMEIKTFAAGVIGLQQGMVNDVLVGDTITVIAGCDKRRATCINTFNNIVNFRGFPDLPGNDSLATIGSR